MAIRNWFKRDKSVGVRSDKVRVDQSEWTILNGSIAKRWSVKGPEVNYEVRIDVHSSRSNVSSNNEPHIFVIVSPHPLGGTQGILSMRFTTLENYRTAPFKVARLENYENDSCIIMHCDLQDTWQSLEVLGGSEPIIISLFDAMSNNVFQTLLPNSSNKLQDLFPAFLSDTDR